MHVPGLGKGSVIDKLMSCVFQSGYHSVVQLRLQDQYHIQFCGLIMQLIVADTLLLTNSIRVPSLGSFIVWEDRPNLGGGFTLNIIRTHIELGII